MKVSTILSAAVTASLLCSCVLNFDTTLPGEQALAGDTDVVGGESDADAGVEPGDLSDAGVDGTESDADLASDSDVEGDLDGVMDVDGTSDADVANGPDGGAALTVEVTEPVAGIYTLGDTLDVVWSTTNADEVTLSLVAGSECADGDAGVTVPVVATLAASTTNFAWDVPTTLAPGDYRLRVRASTLSLQSAVGCSPVFSLQQPAGCGPLACTSQNRTCTVDSGAAACGDCVDGFAETDGVCAAVDCGTAPAAPANATLTSVSTTRYGGIVTYLCSEGYTANGRADGLSQVTRRCGSAGLWEAASAVCTPVECGANPAPAANASFQGVDRTTFGGQASYSCATGYLVAGTGGRGYTLTCNATGSWSTPPACEPVDCGVLTSPANGSVSTPIGTTFGATASYSCDAGYSISGGLATRTCGASGSWGTAPTCNDIDECASGGVCATPNNVCTNLPGSWQCSCAVGATGVAVLGGDAACERTLALGNACAIDADCPTDSWCPTDTTQRFCSPRVSLSDDISMAFQFVPSGTFMMGSPDEGSGEVFPENQVPVAITHDYFVSRTEVTQGQWNAVTEGINPSYFQNTTCRFNSCSSNENANPNGPVENVFWYSAFAYANLISAREGLTPCYTLIPSTCADTLSILGYADCEDVTFLGPSCSGYRLLTEAEWERAARAGTTTDTYMGNLGVEDDCAATLVNLGPIAWYQCNSGNRTREVGGKLPNVWGLYDMLGNVSELTWDYITGPLPGGTDPLGPTTGSFRSVRGGDWTFSSTRAANRSTWCGPACAAGTSIGFRLARTALPAGDCGTPLEIENGTRSYSDTAAGSTVIYLCNSGYTRVGSATLTCHASGNWGTPPTCVDIDECASGSVCTGANNVCTNTIGGWQCSCDDGYTGLTVLGGNTSCIPPPSEGLGALCTADSECPSNSWCSTVSGYRRCSPRGFSGAAHQMDFVFVPSGTYQQGTPGATNEERPYTANISRNYFVSRTEVTQGQWKAATGGTNPSCFQRTSGTTCTTSNLNDTGPVENLDWYSALAFANWLSTSQSLSECYTLSG
ncbi:MAG: SUMF1/EgtB/PvdO family nonheme iron enzyme, partial [Myxococcales bacterium]|nr:SUMF1/EgtB/PvdO family nonheme iron enzyme [Myxococcales bacterium]